MDAFENKNPQEDSRRVLLNAKENFEDKAPQAVAACTKPELVTSKPKVENGNQDEIACVREAHEDAKRMLDHVIAECLEKAKTTPNKSLAEYFDVKSTSEDDKKKIDQLIENYKKIRKGMDNINYEVDQEAIKVGEPFTVAYVSIQVIEPGEPLPLIYGVGPAHIVFPAFQNVLEADRAGTLIHEMSHYILGTDDHAYEFETDKWNKLTASKKMDNADSYGGFARDC